MPKSSVIRIGIIVDTLIIEEDRPKHIARHGVKVQEVLEVVEKDYVYIEGKNGRWLLIGKTEQDRFLTIVIGSRSKKNSYGLITARPASKEERNFYQEFTLQYQNEKDS